MRRFARTDSNQAEIVDAFRKLECTVTPTHQLGSGFPDLAVGVAGVNLLVEVKDGDKSPSDRRLTEDELHWHAEWCGQSCIVENVQDAVLLISGVRAQI